jgi:hypothetical protein
MVWQVMESLEHAMRRGAPIIAEYLGGAVNCDAYHMTDPRADGLGVSSCIERSLEDAGVSPEEVSPFVSDDHPNFVFFFYFCRSTTLVEYIAAVLHFSSVIFKLSPNCSL